MIAAHSLASIAADLDESLGEFVTEMEVPTGDIGLLIPGAPSRTRTVTVESAQWSKLVGILFCLPSTRMGKEEILPGLDYFHHRSAFFVDFFCPGYGAQWPTAEYKDGTPVATVSGVSWLFSAEQFNRSRAEFQAVSKWKFSGETDLLLLVARKTPKATATLDFSTAISCNLEEMIRDQAISSARAFFERIFEFGEKHDGDDPVYELSDSMGLKQGKGFLQEVILSILPEPVRKLYKSSKHFVIQDISK
jgi:hypothetical protein